MREKPAEENTAQRIVTAATELFASKGFDGTSTKEICEAAGVNIAAIHYHFGSKDELYKYIIESFGGYRLQSVQRILAMPENKEELKIRLEMFLDEWLDVCIAQPSLCRIVQIEAELMSAKSEEVFRNTFLKVFETLVSYLSYAKKKNLIAADIDPRIAARSLFSQLSHQTRTDNLTKKFYGVSLRQDAYRKTWIEQTLRVFLCGARAK